MVKIRFGETWEMDSWEVMYHLRFAGYAIYCNGGTYYSSLGLFHNSSCIINFCLILLFWSNFQTLLRPPSLSKVPKIPTKDVCSLTYLIIFEIKIIKLVEMFVWKGSQFMKIAPHRHIETNQIMGRKMWHCEIPQSFELLQQEDVPGEL